MTDEIANYNKARWEDLAQANVEFSRPMLDLDATSARQFVDPYAVMGDMTGKAVLCLASGGGQQSAAFGLLGATVTVLDLSENQLARDKLALDHYGLKATLEQGDMRDLFRFSEDSFDLVWHAWSIGFIPDTAPVFDEVRRVLRPGGFYRLSWGNPFTGSMEISDWTGRGYLLRRPYADGEIVFNDPHWELSDPDGTPCRVLGPREFNHTLSTVVNGLIQRGFTLRGIWEEETGDPNATPGSGDHLDSIAPHDLCLWAVLGD